MQREFTVCDRHVLRINEALSGISDILPIQEEKYKDLSVEQIRCIDQFIFRFSKLQDAIGAKLFRYVLEWWDEDVSYLPMRDILNRLERYQVISSASDWIYIRELKNAIAHDYPVDKKDTVQVLNELVTKTKTLFEIYRKLKTAFIEDVNKDNR